MRQLVLLFVTAFISALPLTSRAHADVLDTGTDQFLSLCKSEQDMCERYVESTLGTAIASGEICIPKGEDDLTITQQVVAWIWQHPDEYGKDTIHSVTDAAFDLWGC